MAFINTGDYILLIEDTYIETDMWSHIKVGDDFLRGCQKEIGKLSPKERAYDPVGYKIIGWYAINEDAPDLSGVKLPNPYKKIENTKYNQLQDILVKQEKDFNNYMANVFTQEEAIKHCGNLLNMLARSNGTIAFLQMMDLSKGDEAINFSLKDIEKALVNFATQAGSMDGEVNAESPASSYRWITKYIKELKTGPLPIDFIPEYENVCGNLNCHKMVLNGENSQCCGDSIKKIIKVKYNSDGKDGELVGSYKYKSKEYYE